MVEVQRHATHALLEVLRGRSLTAVLGLVWSRHPALSNADRAAIQDLAYGACRWLGTLREVLRLALNKPTSDAEVEALLLVALYQLQWTRAPAHAVVDGAVRTCARLGKASAKGLVNAVLRRFLRERDSLLERARATPRGPFLLPAVVDRRARARLSGSLRGDPGRGQPASSPDVARQSPPRIGRGLLASAGRCRPACRADRSSGRQAATPCTGRIAAGIRRRPGLGAGPGGATCCRAAGRERRHARTGCLRRAGRQGRSPAGDRRCRPHRDRPRSAAPATGAGEPPAAAPRGTPGHGRCGRPG